MHMAIGAEGFCTGRTIEPGRAGPILDVETARRLCVGESEQAAFERFLLAWLLRGCLRVWFLRQD